MSLNEKILEAKLSRDREPDTKYVVPGYALTQLLRQAMKETVRGMEGQ